MNVLVTGGAGYIGSELIKKLYNNHEVSKIIIYDNLSRNNYNIFTHSGIPHGKVNFIKGELLDSRKLREVLVDIDVVYHLAARVSTPMSNESSHLYEQVNNWGTAELVYAAEESQVKKFIYVSSLSVFGSHSHEISVDSEPSPSSFYGISKFRGEQHVSRLNSKMETYIIRFANIYGWGTSMRFDAVINNFMFNACFNNRISIHGDGSQRRTFIHINKAVHFLSELLGSNCKAGTYHLADKILSINEISEVLKQVIPSLEMVHINQHIKMRELIVVPDLRILPFFNHITDTFQTEMENFKNNFYRSGE